MSAALVLLAAVGAAGEELRTLTGQNLSGTLLRVTDAEIVLATGTGQVATPIAQALALDFATPKAVELPRYSTLRLIDDSTWHCSALALKGKEVVATLSSGLTVTVPLAAVVTLQHDAGNKSLKKKWSEVASGKIKRDRLVVLRDGELNTIEGVIGDADPDGTKISFKSDAAGTTIDVLLDKVHGLVFWRPDPPAETPICKVLDRDGNVLHAVKLGYDGNVLSVQTVFGSKTQLRRELLARLDFNFGRLTYLSDLEPVKVVEKSRIGVVVGARYRKDANLEGDAIFLDGKSFAKGLSMHAYTELEYDLGGKYKDLKGLLGIDTRVLADSRVKVAIWCDGEIRKEFVVTPTTPAKERQVAINVKDVHTLKIVVAGRDFLDLGDHVTFADARVSQ
ncbi:MAG: NPCBM/NEW2 domain-containing protein [Gemmataceae bacterium]|nr:NPCBM/NEW2 domain-containing protein [Gemmataceae bacterium]